MAGRRIPAPAKPRSAPTAAEPASVRPLWLPLVILALGAWAYSTSLAGVFVLDDVRAIVRNPTIRTLSPLSTPLSPAHGVHGGGPARGESVVRDQLRAGAIGRA